MTSSRLSTAWGSAAAPLRWRLATRSSVTWERRVTARRCCSARLGGGVGAARRACPKRGDHGGVDDDGLQGAHHLGKAPHVAGIDEAAGLAGLPSRRKASRS